MSIMDKLKKNSKIKETATLSTSKFFTEKDMVPTDVPMVNVALSGSVNGGISPGSRPYLQVRLNTSRPHSRYSWRVRT